MSAVFSLFDVDMKLTIPVNSLSLFFTIEPFAALMMYVPSALAVPHMRYVPFSVNSRLVTAKEKFSEYFFLSVFQSQTETRFSIPSSDSYTAMSLFTGFFEIIFIGSSVIW